MLVMMGNVLRILDTVYTDVSTKLQRGSAATSEKISSEQGRIDRLHWSHKFAELVLTVIT